MKKTITIIAALSLACGNISALDYDKIPLKEEPVNISTIKNIGGFIGDRMRLNRNTYLKHFPIEKYVEFIEEQIGYPITMVSNGPGREDIIIRESPLRK